MICDVCGTENEDGSVFCMKCGTALKASDNTVQIPTPTSGLDIGEPAKVGSAPEENRPSPVPEWERPNKRKFPLKTAVIACAVLIALILIVIAFASSTSPENLVYTVQDTSSNGSIVALNELQSNGTNNHELYSDADGLSFATSIFNFVLPSPSFFSPDGKTLALLENKTNNIILLPMDGRAPAVIEAGTNNSSSYVIPGGFSPNNKYYSYGTVSYGSTQETTLFLTDLNGNEVHNVPGYFTGKFLPNGKQMVVENLEQKSGSSANALFSLALLDLASGEVQTSLTDTYLTTQSNFLPGFFLSSDGRRVFVQNEQGLGQISIGGGDTKDLYASKNIIQGFALNDGVNLVLVEIDPSQGNQNANLYLMNTKRKTRIRIDRYLGQSQKVSSLFATINYQLDESPNSRYLAYSSDNGDGTYDMNIVSTNSSNKLSLAKNGSWYSFAFSPDNKHIAYIEGSNKNEGGTLIISDFTGRNRIRLDSNVWSFRFVEKGKKLVYTTVEDLARERPLSTIVSISPNGKQRKVLVQAEDGLYTLLP